MSDRGDIVDRGNERAAQMTADSEAAIRRAAAAIPTGEPGECGLCGEWSGRLVNGACAPCRDHYKLP